MKWYGEYRHPDGRHFIIEDGGRVGLYLYVYYNRDRFQEDFNDPGLCQSHQEDHLQDTFDVAKEQAFGGFGVPVDSWKEISG